MYVVAFSAVAPPVAFTLGFSVMESQLSNQQVITFNSVHHAVLVCYAA
jgi:hypothetical protein